MQTLAEATAKGSVIPDFSWLLLKTGMPSLLP